MVTPTPPHKYGTSIQYGEAHFYGETVTNSRPSNFTSATVSFTTSFSSLDGTGVTVVTHTGV